MLGGEEGGDEKDGVAGEVEAVEEGRPDEGKDGDAGMQSTMGLDEGCISSRHHPVTLSGLPLSVSTLDHPAFLLLCSGRLQGLAGLNCSPLDAHTPRQFQGEGR